MRDLARLFALFLVAALAIGAAYVAGFATAVEVRERALETALVSQSGSPDAAVGGTSVPTRSTSPAADNFGVFWEAWKVVQDEFYGELPENLDVTYGAIRGSLRALGDPYTVFTDPEDTAVNRPNLEGEFEGIGAYVTQNEDGQLVIQTPMRGQPAERAGVLPGDIVVKVDGQDIGGMDINDAVLLIRGPKGTTVELTIFREGEEDVLTIPVVRDRIEIPSVNQARLLEEEGAPEVGYLQLTEFAADTRVELEKEMDALRAGGAEALIVDVRNNPGGFLSTAIEVSSEFIDEGVIVIQEDNEGHRKREFARPGGHWLDLPVVVLVNRGSASASEILAGAIRDHDRGLLVGDTTFGKGSVQNVHTLSDESQLRVTVAVWLTPDGHLIHEQGIAPDVEIAITDEDREAERDPQLEAAIQSARDLIEGR
jgi:carboxyl-terminal processing protease